MARPAQVPPALWSDTAALRERLRAAVVRALSADFVAEERFELFLRGIEPEISVAISYEPVKRRSGPRRR